VPRLLWLDRWPTTPFKDSQTSRFFSVRPTTRVRPNVVTPTPQDGGSCAVQASSDDRSIGHCCNADAGSVEGPVSGGAQRDRSCLSSKALDGRRLHALHQPSIQLEPTRRVGDSAISETSEHAVKHSRLPHSACFNRGMWTRSQHCQTYVMPTMSLTWMPSPGTEPWKVALPKA